MGAFSWAADLAGDSRHPSAPLFDWPTVALHLFGLILVSKAWREPRHTFLPVLLASPSSPQRPLPRRTEHGATGGALPVVSSPSQCLQNLAEEQRSRGAEGENLLLFLLLRSPPFPLFILTLHSPNTYWGFTMWPQTAEKPAPNTKLSGSTQSPLACDTEETSLRDGQRLLRPLDALTIQRSLNEDPHTR
ncbi:MAG: hypothetical protein IPL28_05215 [Chloroflexi bacterium]|nr:hypothetical protein [Chloroflexota bacterium]